MAVMLCVSIVLLLLGVAACVAEAMIPGFGFFGITGIILLAASVVITIVFIPSGIFIVVGEVAVAAALGFLAFDFLRKKRVGGIVLDESLGMDEAEPPLVAVGDVGVTKTTLRPVGYALFNGVAAEVHSEGTYIKEGRSVKVSQVRASGITVTEVPQ